jgi:hypothetical protein
MKTWDLEKFKAMLPKGYKIGRSSRHHTIVNPEGMPIIVFPLCHAKGSKLFILDHYVKDILQAIHEDQER